VVRSSPEVGDSQVKPNSLYRVFRQAAEDSGDVKACFLLQITNRGEAEAGFRYTLEGSESIEMDFMAKDLVDFQETKDFLLRCDLLPEDIDLEANTLSSRWEDLDELVAGGKLVPTTGESLAAKTAEFRRHMAAWKVADPEAGAAVRWALRSGEGEGLYLILQGLPASAKTLRQDARLLGDGCPTVELTSMKMSTDWRGDGPTRGPIPMLFARNPEEASSALEHNPENLTNELR
jgi:hypothetical protein